MSKLLNCIHTLDEIGGRAPEGVAKPLATRSPPEAQDYISVFASSSGIWPHQLNGTRLSNGIADIRRRCQSPHTGALTEPDLSASLVEIRIIHVLGRTAVIRSGGACKATVQTLHIRAD